MHFTEYSSEIIYETESISSESFEICDVFADEIGTVYLKPHPDDKIMYSLFKDVYLVEPKVLSELLWFETKAKFNTTICAVSSAANNLTDVGNKVIFDTEFSKNYKDLIKYYSAALYLSSLNKKLNICPINLYNQMFVNCLKFGNNCNYNNFNLVLNNKNKNIEKLVYVVKNTSDAENLKSLCRERDILISFERFSFANEKLTIKTGETETQEIYLYSQFNNNFKFTKKLNQISKLLKIEESKL